MLKDSVRSSFACAALLAASAVSSSAAPLHVVQLRVDGRDDARIGSGVLAINHFSWGLPDNLVVDGTPRPLTWVGTSTNPVPAFTGDYWVRKTLGQDGGYAVQFQNGYALSVADNPVGTDTYRFEFSAAPDANTFEWMHVLGGAGTPGKMSFAGLPGYNFVAAGAKTTFSLKVDGTDELRFSNGALVISHISWGEPESFKINGVAQPLTFTNGLSQPIALPMPDAFQFTQTAGRSKLYPVQTPAGFLLAADDELDGTATYTWTITSIPEPAGPTMAAAALAAFVWRRRRRGAAAL